jgi:nicotinate-nucleotide adenylyltransferase
MGHSAVLAVAKEQLELDLLIVVPTGTPYHKDVESEPGREVRFRLAEAAFGGLYGVEISRIEVDRNGPSYTCDTLEEIENVHPDSEIHLLMGADSAKGFAGWHRPERILELATVAVAPRVEVESDEVKEVFARLGGEGRLRFLEMPEVTISSSQVRERIGKGEAYRNLVPGPVAEIIENEDLYGI